MVWRDEAASPEACAELRRALGMQVWPHRLSAGFPEDDVVVSGKTGTLPGFRAEAGVIELPSDRIYAAAVVTRSEQPALNHPRVDAAIGATARMAVMALEQR
jgi:beta-lactamase class A